MILLLACSPSAPAKEQLGEQLLAGLIQRAYASHPSLAAARQEIEVFAARRAMLQGLFDPQLAISASHAGDLQTIPGISSAMAARSDASQAEVGIEQAFLPGFYAGTGAAHRYFDNSNGLTEELAGVHLRVPLWRDRGFAVYRLADAEAAANIAAASARHLQAHQILRYRVSQAFIAYQEANSLLSATRAAEQRVKSLAREATELVRLQVVPEYQLHQALMAVRLREEEQRGALERFEVAAETLAQLVALSRDRLTPLAPEELIQWTSHVQLQDSASGLTGFSRVGAWLELSQRIEAAHSGLARSEEELKPDLSIAAAAHWRRSEYNDNGSGDAHAWNGGIQLVYTRPLHFSTAQAELAEQHATTQNLIERQRDLELEIQTARQLARLRFDSARQRLRLTLDAVHAANQTMLAEAERFRLGEGRSRQVLDAQKDLTDVILLQAANAARLLRAHTDYQFYYGYPDEMPNQEATDAEP